MLGVRVMGGMCDVVDAWRGVDGLREKKMKTAYLWMLWTPWCVDVILAVVVVKKLICL